jgi:predicted anti-sigma-YlaC factor YlaD
MPHIKEEQVSAYIDKQLTAEESRAVELHLNDCADCRSVFEEMSEITHLFHQAEHFKPSPFLWNRIEANLETEIPAPSRWGSSFIAGLLGFAKNPRLAAATLAVFMFVGITVIIGTKSYMADQAALAKIDLISRDLASLDPDYNPFSSGSPRESDENPFKSIRRSGKISSASPTALPH